MLIAAVVVVVVVVMEVDIIIRLIISEWFYVLSETFNSHRISEMKKNTHKFIINPQMTYG